jgi:pimeloyl-ACP methyl ester carboxylesterase
MSTNLMGTKWRTHYARFGILLILCAVLLASIAGSTDANAAGRRPGHVYLMRGVLNVFSLGLDELASKLQAAGVAASVQNYAGWQGLADDIAANYRAGNREPVILMGHSLGADATISVARRLQGSGVPVALIVNFDPVSPDPVPPNVRQIVNYYVPAGWGQAVAADKRFRGNLANVNEDATDNHFSIDKSENLHRKTIAKVLQVTGGARRAPKKPANAQVSAAPAQ